MFLAKKILASLILPPTGLLLLALFGLWLARSKSQFWRNGGLMLATVSVLATLTLTVPLVGSGLMQTLERSPPVTEEQLRDAQAIVILGGGLYHDAPEYGGSTVNTWTLQRVRYGARLAQTSHLPVLVTGGAPFGGIAEAVVMAQVLRDEYGVDAGWIEPESRDTAENAEFSARILKREGIARVALVSHGWHLPRAIPLFQSAGLEVIPAPTAFTTSGPSLLGRLLPADMHSSYFAIHEYLGMLFNRLKEL